MEIKKDRPSVSVQQSLSYDSNALNDLVRALYKIVFAKILIIPEAPLQIDALGLIKWTRFRRRRLEAPHVTARGI